MTACKIMIVDDHPIFVHGLARLLGGESWCEVVVTTGDADEAMTLATEFEPDVAIVDLRLGDADGIDLCERLLRLRPTMAVTLLTMHADSAAVRRALAAGAHGYLLKDAPPDEVIESIHHVARGGLSVGSSVAGEVRTALSPAATHRAVGDLTPRQLDLLRLLGRGLQATEIGRELFLAPKTVRNQLSELYGRLGVTSRVEAALIAREVGLT